MHVTEYEEEKEADLKVKNSVKLILNFKSEALDCDTSEQVKAIFDAVDGINPEDYGTHSQDAKETKEYVLAFLDHVHDDYVAKEKKADKLKAKQEAKEKKDLEDAEVLAKKEANQRRNELALEVSACFWSNKPGEVEAQYSEQIYEFIKTIENNEIPYLRIDWTSK